MRARPRVGIATARLVILGFVGHPQVAANSMLHCGGASVHVPGGWHGRVSPGGGGGFLLMVSTAPFAAVKGDVLGGTLARLERGGVLITLLGYGQVDIANTAFPQLRSG